MGIVDLRGILQERFFAVIVYDLIEQYRSNREGFRIGYDMKGFPRWRRRVFGRPKEEGQGKETVWGGLDWMTLDLERISCASSHEG